MKRALFVVFVAFLAGSTLSAAELFTPAYSPRRIATEAVVVRNAVHEVVLNRAAITAPDLTVTLEGRTYQARSDKTTVRGAENSVRSFILDNAGSTSTLTVYHGAVVGWFWTPTSDLYELRVQPDGYATVQWVDQSRSFHCAEIPTGWPGLAGNRKVQADALSVSPLRHRAVSPVQRTIIRVMMVYDTEAMTDEGGAVSMDAYLQAALDQTNTAAAASGVDWVEFDLVHAELVDYAYPGDDPDGVPRAALSWVSADPGVASLRAMYQADEVGVVVQATNNTGGGGVAHMPINDAGFVPSSGFFAVNISSQVLAINFQFAVMHELGHTMGMAHNVEDPATAMVGIAHPWAFAYRYDPAKYQTVMGVYRDPATGRTWPQFLRYSNPALTYSLLWYDSQGPHYTSIPTGSEFANNAKELAIGAAFVAKYHLELGQTGGNPGGTPP